MKVSVILSLYRCEKYLETYFNNALEQNRINEVEFSIIHNDATSVEIDIIKRFQKKLNIIYKNVKRENLYSSWNRAIIQSKGEYLVCWNVDDLRTSDSIEKMIECLDKNPEIGFTYGNFITVKKFKSRNGIYVKAPNFSFKKGTTGAIGGPFFMWRRELTNKVGYFDEQFKSGGDFDFTVRLSIFSKGKKVNAVLGYFLNEGFGLSTKSLELQILEREVISRRYGIWWKSNLFLNNRVKSYNLNYIKEFGKLRKINHEIVELFRLRLIKKHMILASTVKEELIFTFRRIKRLISK